MAALLTLMLLIPSTVAHVAMSWPYPLRSKHNPATPQNLIDYNMIAPLQASGADFPCKGYQLNTPEDIVATYNAGSSYNVTFEGSATHGGGSCQLSLSYDNGKTFKAIKSMIGGCPLTSTYDFTIPKEAPSGQALFAWTWSNFMGNREFYMNCASVRVVGTPSYRQIRDTTTSFDSLPNIWVADLSSINKCTTNGPTGSMNPVYPSPGPDVVYASGMNSSSPATPGNCEFPLVARQAAAPSFTYNPDTSTTPATVSSTANTGTSTSLVSTSVGFVTMPSASSSSISSSISTASASISLLSTSISIVTMPSQDASSSSAAQSSTADTPAITSSSTNAASSASMTFASFTTVTMTVDCPSIVTVTMPPTSYLATYTVSLPSSVCTATTANCPCNVGYSCLAVGTCTWACMAMPATASMSSFQTLTIPTTMVQPTIMIQSTSTLSTQSASSLPTTSPNPPALGYADQNNLQAYLPCVPGSFICTDASTWYTCDQMVAGGWSYQYPRQVAAGMQCLPYLSPSGSNSQYGQQGNTPQGYYRDDQYIRASI